MALEHIKLVERPSTSSCCGAAVRFFDATLICKKCYQEQSLDVLIER